jgi:hypothetical protein
MKTKRRAEPVPIAPKDAWSTWGEDAADAINEAREGRTLRVKLPKARRLYQRVDTDKAGRFLLLWAGDVSEAVTIVAGVGDAQDWRTVAFILVDGSVAFDCMLERVIGRPWGWHRRRIVETAKAVAAQLREGTAPAVDGEGEQWLRQQLTTLNTEGGA